MLKLEQALESAQAGRLLSASTPLLREWGCGEITVAVDASLRVIVATDGTRVVVDNVPALLTALTSAERFAGEAGEVSDATATG